MAELAEMDDHMLSDLVVHRSEIEGRLRRPRADFGTDDVSRPTFTRKQGQPRKPQKKRGIDDARGRRIPQLT